MERLDDAERTGDDGDRDHPADEREQQSGPAVGDRRVEHVPEQERRDDAERRRDEDQRADGATAGAGTAGTACAIRRRLARRTALSAGRSGASPDEKPWERRPGMTQEYGLEEC